MQVSLDDYVSFRLPVCRIVRDLCSAHDPSYLSILSRKNIMAAPFPYHVLDFFHDDENGAALTVLLHGIRFHVIADAEKLGCETSLSPTRAAQEYLQLLQKVKQLDGKQSGAEDNENGDSDNESAGVDSGIDMTAPKLDGSLNGAEKALHSWMLAPLSSDFTRHAPARKEKDEITLDQWYDCPTHFFELEVGKKGLQAIELEATPEMQDRMRNLRPELKVPKYIRDIDVPWYSASDLVVLGCSDELAAYHPCRVRLNDSHDDRTFFIKVVDEAAPNKREIKLLSRIAQLDLHSEISCPRLEALVTFASPASMDYYRNSILGFLQTDIKNPVPLTHKLDTSVPQEQREKWAKEADRTKAVLHKKGIVWGDAQADNFMVDKDDRLWIIDFGGSYTEGWVDKELNETKEGDDMGVQKIVNALEDPVANTIGSDDDDDDKKEEKEQGKAKQQQEEEEEEKRKISPSIPRGETRKRRATDDLDKCVISHKTKTPRLFVTQPSHDEPNDGAETDTKEETDREVGDDRLSEEGTDENDVSNSGGHVEAETDEQDSADEPVYCYCQSASAGDMIACDNVDCQTQWFHFRCAGISSAPPKGEKWYCKDCQSSLS
nr:chromatin modification-related protein yng2 [Quercus suber]